jgi:hypothetical protein
MLISVSLIDKNIHEDCLFTHKYFNFLSLYRYCYYLNPISKCIITCHRTIKLFSETKGGGRYQNRNSTPVKCRLHFRTLHRAASPHRKRVLLRNRSRGNLKFCLKELLEVSVLLSEHILFLYPKTPYQFIPSFFTLSLWKQITGRLVAFRMELRDGSSISVMICLCQTLLSYRFSAFWIRSK